jgi:hypothetical protein
MTTLVDELAATLIQLGAPLQQGADPIPHFIVSVRDTEVLCFSEGRVVWCVCPIVSATGDEQVEALRLIESVAPIPDEFRSMASYVASDRDILLVIELPMPRSVNPVLFADAMTLIVEVLDRLAS